ncbi:hypothetical protein [Spirillospora sp. NPDC029432]|uniref:hypothetical protein n=1 Tax=Spirillospora sp. NPDC029432 TaxID=3154599 RepID=UPI0034539CFB
MRPDGGDPEPDDYGLPRVDVVVPDDARELDRDVVAYHREERRRRRRDRTRRILRPFGRYGVAVPIIAGALLIALISGGLMTVFGPRPAPRPTAALLAPHPSAGPGRVGGYLPEGTVTRLGKEDTPMPLREMRPAVIGIVPAGCRCEAVVDELAGNAKANQLNFWLAADRRGTSTASPSSPSSPSSSSPSSSSPSSSSPSSPAPAEQALRDLRTLAGTVHAGTPLVVDDAKGILASTYGTGALTAVLVQPDGVVAHVVPSPRPGRELTDKIRSLR